MHATLARLDAQLPGDALVVSSDLKRARCTADVFSQTRARLPDNPDLRELNFGCWEGLLAEEIAARDAVRSQTFWQNPTKAHPPGGERWSDLTRRVADTIESLIAGHPGRPLVAVAHYGVIVSHYMHITQGDWATGARAHVTTLSLSRFVHDGHHWHAASLNETFADEVE